MGLSKNWVPRNPVFPIEITFVGYIFVWANPCKEFVDTSLPAVPFVLPKAACAGQLAMTFQEAPRFECKDTEGFWTLVGQFLGQKIMAQPTPPKVTPSIRAD